MIIAKHVVYPMSVFVLCHYRMKAIIRRSPQREQKPPSNAPSLTSVKQFSQGRTTTNETSLIPMVIRNIPALCKHFRPTLDIRSKSVIMF